MILVSACLTGIRSRYDGRHSLSQEIQERLSSAEWVAVCPEQLGGLHTPRPSAGIEGGTGTDVLAGRTRVKTAEGIDVTSAYIQGAEAVLEIAQRFDVTTCFLKDRSPSCGVSSVVDQNEPVDGPGVCAALLLQHGFVVVQVKAVAEPAVKGEASQ